MLINAIAQAEALARGSVDLINQNKNFLGGRPSTIISWEENTPFSIGMLMLFMKILQLHLDFFGILIALINGEWNLEKLLLTRSPMIKMIKI